MGRLDLGFSGSAHHSSGPSTLELPRGEVRRADPRNFTGAERMEVVGIGSSRVSRFRPSLRHFGRCPGAIRSLRARPEALRSGTIRAWRPSPPGQSLDICYLFHENMYSIAHVDKNIWQTPLIQVGHGRHRCTRIGRRCGAGSFWAGSAANVSVGQCNGINDTPGLTTTCDVVIINNLTNNPGTTGSSVTLNGGIPTTSSDLVTSVLQCNNSGNGGGGTMTCNVSITNNIAVNGPGAPSAATVNQCVGSGGPLDGSSGDPLGPPLPGNPDPCTPYPATTTGATITQCNGSAGGGGLVAPSTCDASGTVSSSLPVTVNQCNNSVNGGGSMINCSTTITIQRCRYHAHRRYRGYGWHRRYGWYDWRHRRYDGRHWRYGRRHSGGTAAGTTPAGGTAAHGSGGTAAGSTSGSVIPLGAPQPASVVQPMPPLMS